MVCEVLWERFRVRSAVRVDAGVFYKGGEEVLFTNERGCWVSSCAALDLRDGGCVGGCEGYKKEEVGSGDKGEKGMVCEVL
jgi:hypothetical protein